MNAVARRLASATPAAAGKAQYAVDRAAYKKRMTEMRRKYLAERAAAVAATPNMGANTEEAAAAEAHQAHTRAKAAAARDAEREHDRAVREKNRAMLAELRKEVLAARASVSALRRRERAETAEAHRLDVIRRETTNSVSYLTDPKDIPDFVSQSLAREVDYDMKVGRSTRQESS